MIRYYIDVNNNKYIDINNNYFIQTSDSNYLPYNSYIYYATNQNKRYAAYIYINGTYVKVKPYIKTRIEEAIAGVSIVGIARAGSLLEGE